LVDFSRLAWTSEELKVASHGVQLHFIVDLVLFLELKLLNYTTL